MKIKITSGVKRFQEEPQFGNRLDNFYPVITSMAICQPKQSVEPSALNGDGDDDNYDANSGQDLSRKYSQKKMENQEREICSLQYTNVKEKKEKLYIERLIQSMNTSIQELTKQLKFDLIKEILYRDYMTDILHEKTSRDDMFLQLMGVIVAARQVSQYHSFCNQSVYGSSKMQSTLRGNTSQTNYQQSNCFRTPSSGQGHRYEMTSTIVNENAFSSTSFYSQLRILKGKKHRQIKLQRLEKVRI